METPDPTYSCRLQPLQPEYVFTLTSEALVVERASKTTRAPYRDIESVRLSFLPRGFYVTGFRTAIRAPGARTIKFDDASFSTGFLQERQSRAYRVFTLDLLERVRRCRRAASWAPAGACPARSEIGPAHGFQRLAQHRPVLGIVIAQEGLVQAALAQPLTVDRPRSEAPRRTGAAG
jgi:hypothetical protein